LYVVQNAVGIFNQEHDLVEYRGYIFNDTQRRQLEEQLRQAQKMESMGTLAGGIAHDFNNIMNNVIGFANQIKKHLAEPDKVLRYSETIEKSASRGAALTNQLLAFSRPKKRENAVIDIPKLIRDVVTLAKETFPKTVVVEESISDNLFALYGDYGALFQVLLNISVNARDAMPNGGTLRFVVSNRTIEDAHDPLRSLIDAARCIEIRIVDTGIGMSEEVRQRIFDPFFTTKDKDKGTGLGLSIVFNVIKDHGGTVFVESEEGNGSMFTLYLPAYELSTLESIPDESTELRKSKNELILLVDDEEPMRQLGKELLEEHGYRVLLAEDGEQAVETYKEHRTDISLVILDLIMPKKDGGQTYIELKKIDSGVRALFCSGYTSDRVITQLLEQENLRAIQKPFHPDAFIRVIQEVIDAPLSS
jgi:signal transduction histidine kinase/ActR/RegA family two-component response regulator